MTKATSSVPPVKSAIRTVELLEFLAAHRGLHSLGDIQQAMNYPRSSLYVLLRTLTSLNWIETDQTGTLYRIGVRPLLVGTSYLDSDPVVAAGRPTLDWIAGRLDETVHLARLEGGDVVYLATRDSQHTLRPFSRVGRRLPAYCTSLGKALLAQLDDDEVRALLPDTLVPLTEHSVTSADALLADLAQVRRQGYSTDLEENTMGLRCIGMALRIQVPVRDAISCSVPTVRLPKKRIPEIEAVLREGRDRIEAATSGLFRSPR